MSFIIGETYTRETINQALGGETVTYLPQQDGKITCGCFNLKENPQAPYLIRLYRTYGVEFR